MHKTIPSVDIDSLSEHRDDDIMISRFSEYLEIHRNLILPHRHSFYHLLLFTEGAGNHTIDFNHFEVKPYQIYFMIPGQVHSWDFEGKVDGYVVNFSGDFFQSFLLRPGYVGAFSFFSGTASESVINLTEEVAEEILPIFEDLLVRYNAKQKFREDLIRLLLLQIFILIEQNQALSEAPTRFSGNQTIKNFQRLVEKHFLELRLPGAYAELLYVTTNHLNALCKEHLGKQAGEVIRERIVLEAKRLLINVDLSVAEIAYRLNFNDNSYFTRFFKKHEGMTPDEFRKRTTNKRL